MQLTALEASVTAGTTKTLCDPMVAIAPSFLAAWAARSDWIQAHTERLRRLTRVMADAAAYVNGHPTETIPYVVELTRVDPTVVAKMKRTIIAPNIGAPLVQPIIDAAARYDIIPRRFDAREILWTG
jgi:ABC-type nitrate/sulfonate/bicarbonate transport system substrate-binding protein